MRVLHIDTGEEMRGGQRQVLLLLSGLIEAGHECRLLAPQGSPLAAAAKEAGVRVERATFLQVGRQSRWADLLHAHTAHAHTLAAFGTRRPFVVSRRVAFPVKRSLASRWKYARAASFLAVSQFVKQRLMEAGVRPERIHVVYDAVPQPQCKADWNPEYPAIALASHDPQKGRSLVEEASRLSGVAVHFSNELSNDLRKASMFIYISQSEGLGSAAILALSMGVPVIASNVDGLLEVFEDQVSGLFVFNHAAPLVRAMRRVLSDRALSLRMIAEGRARARKLFSVEALIRDTIASYRSVLES